MIDDENYNQTKKVRDWTKKVRDWTKSEFKDLTSEQRKPQELILAIMDAMLELQALPEDASREEFLAKAKVVGDLQQKALDLGILTPGPSKESTTKGLEISLRTLSEERVMRQPGVELPP
jgi:hypothetical protein